MCWKAWNSGGYAYFMAESLKIGINRQPPPPTGTDSYAALAQLQKANKGFQQQPMCRTPLFSAVSPIFCSCPLYQISGLHFTLCQEQDLKYFIFLKKQTRASPLNQGHPCALLFYPTLKPPLDMYRPSFLRLCLSAFKTSD